MPMRSPHASLVLAILFVVPGAHASPLSIAAENLLYFEHAKATLQHCEQRGRSVRPAFDKWWQNNSALHQASLQAIRNHAAGGGLSAADQDAMVNASIANQRRLALEQIARRGVDCEKYGQVLDTYTALLKR
jgi:hypothetical protein